MTNFEPEEAANLKDAERYRALRNDVAEGTGLYSHSRFGPVCATPEQLDAKADAMRRMSKSLFQLGEFVLHSGQKSIFKIECDNLTDEDIETFAKMASHISFKSVEGIPRGGVRFAEALKKYTDPDSDLHLVVDDVFTTGASMQEAIAAARWRGEEVVRGLAIFSRGTPDDGTEIIFSLNAFWGSL
jgi:orotate phosphoribosyltransferase